MGPNISRQEYTPRRLEGTERFEGTGVRRCCHDRRNSLNVNRIRPSPSAPVRLSYSARQQASWAR